MPRTLALIVAACLFAAASGATDLKAVEEEKNNERRSELAINNASAALEEAKRAYSDGKAEAFQAELKEVQDSVNLCYASLTEGKPLNRNARHAKKAELQIRLLLRKLNDFEKAVGADERAQVEGVRKSVSDIHDKFVFGIMEKRRK